MKISIFFSTHDTFIHTRKHLKKISKFPAWVYFAFGNDAAGLGSDEICFATLGSLASHKPRYIRKVTVLRPLRLLYTFPWYVRSKLQVIYSAEKSPLSENSACKSKNYSITSFREPSPLKRHVAGKLILSFLCQLQICIYMNKQMSQRNCFHVDSYMF